MARPEVRTDSRPSSEAGLSVLLVEDTPSERWLYTEILRTRGHAVTACEDADQAWEAWLGGEFPLVMLDLRLPGDLDGLALCRRIRAHEQGKRAIILVVTGHDEPETLEAVLEAGGDDYIRKPVDVGLLNVRLAIAEREARRELLRHETDVALERTSHELSTLFRNLDDVFFSVAWGDDRLIQISPACQRLLGHTQQEMLENRALFHDLILPAEARTRLEARSSSSEESERLVHPFAIRRADGVERWVQASYKPIVREGEIVRVDGVLTDITERQRSQVELAARNREIATIARLTEIALAAPDSDSAFVEILEEVSRASGYPIVALEEWDTASDTMIIRHARGIDVSPTAPIRIPVHETLSGKAVHEGKPVVETDLRTNRRHRSEALLDLELQTWLAFPLLTGSKARGTLTLAHTEQIPPEPRLIRLGMSMAAAIAGHMERLAAQEALRDNEQRYRQLAEALQQANQELESFAYSVSHDLRAPLRTMQGFAHALLQNHGTGLPEEARDFARRIIASGEKAESLISDLLAYSRLSSENLEIRPVELQAVLRDVMDRLEGDIRARGAEVKIDSNLPRVRAHHVTLVQVVGNLVANAVKFVPEDRTPMVRVRAETHTDGSVRLEVRDNGVGVPRDKADRIFRVFERLADQAHREGTGIGLALVRRGMERLGGVCGVEPAEGGGSIFWIHIPNRPRSP